MKGAPVHIWQARILRGQAERRTTVFFGAWSRAFQQPAFPDLGASPLRTFGVSFIATENLLVKYFSL